MSDDPDLSADDIERLMARIGEHLAATGGGELDEERFRAAAEAVLNLHRERGSRVDDMIERGATMFTNVKPDERKIEFRLGWPDEWPNKTVAGKTVHLGLVPLAELLRGGQG